MRTEAYRNDWLRRVRAEMYTVEGIALPTVSSLVKPEVSRGKLSFQFSPGENVQAIVIPAGLPDPSTINAYAH